MPIDSDGHAVIRTQWLVDALVSSDSDGRIYDPHPMTPMDALVSSDSDGQV